MGNALSETGFIRNSSQVDYNMFLFSFDISINCLVS